MLIFPTFGTADMFSKMVIPTGQEGLPDSAFLPWPVLEMVSFFHFGHPARLGQSMTVTSTHTDDSSWHAETLPREPPTYFYLFLFIK